MFKNNFLQGAKTGKDHGFSLLFDIESYDYYSFKEGSEGLKLALVHHLDMPIMRQKGKKGFQLILLEMPTNTGTVSYYFTWPTVM